LTAALLSYKKITPGMYLLTIVFAILGAISISAAMPTVDNTNLPWQLVPPQGLYETKSNTATASRGEISDKTSVGVRQEHDTAYVERGVPGIGGHGILHHNVCIFPHRL
jgi:hypothetical protein